MKRPILANRRSRPRIDVLLKANFSVGGRPLAESECLITDISVSGAGLVFHGLAGGSLAAGLGITLGFAIPGTDRNIHVQGDIIWIRENKTEISAGVAFSEPLSFEEIMKCCFKNEPAN